MADRQLVFSEVTGAPQTILPPADSEFLLKSVRATFVDAGAGADWLPSLSIVSDSGHTVADSADQGVKVTAGDDAKVSWFPGVKPQTASAAPTSSGLPWGLLAGDGGPFTIDDTGGINLIDLTPPAASDFYTIDTSTFTTGTYTVGGGSIGCLEILKPGSYRLIVNGNWTTLQAAAVGEVNQIFYSVPNASGFNANWLYGRQAVQGSDTWAGVPGTLSAGVQTFAVYLVNIFGSTPPVQIPLWALQYNATGNGVLSYVQVYAEQISPTHYAGAANFPGTLPPYN